VILKDLHTENYCSAPFITVLIGLVSQYSGNISIIPCKNKALFDKQTVV